MNTPSGGGPSDDGGVEILDSGLGGDGGDGAGATDAGGQGATDAGGQSATDAGGGPGGGGPGGGGGGFPLADGGFPLPDGGGLSEYQGEPEPGVLCGEELDACAAGAACCVTLSFTSFSFVGACSASDDQVCPAGEFVIGCDDPTVDCSEGQVCCLTGVASFTPNATCTDAATCDAEATGGDRVCTSASDCANGDVCCGLAGFTLPIDVGVCQPSCEGI